MEPAPLTRDQIQIGFVASCIEDVADKLGVNYLEVLDRMEAVGMIDGYIYPCYDALHTESRENLTKSLIETLLHRERERSGDGLL